MKRRATILGITMAVLCPCHCLAAPFPLKGELLRYETFSRTVWLAHTVTLRGGTLTSNDVARIETAAMTIGMEAALEAELERKGITRYVDGEEVDADEAGSPYVLYRNSRRSHVFRFYQRRSKQLARVRFFVEGYGTVLAQTVSRHILATFSDGDACRGVEMTLEGSSLPHVRMGRVHNGTVSFGITDRMPARIEWRVQ